MARGGRARPAPRGRMARGGRKMPGGGRTCGGPGQRACGGGGRAVASRNTGGKASGKRRSDCPPGVEDCWGLSHYPCSKPGEICYNGCCQPVKPTPNTHPGMLRQKGGRTRPKPRGRGRAMARGGRAPMRRFQAGGAGGECPVGTQRSAYGTCLPLDA